MHVGHLKNVVPARLTLARASSCRRCRLRELALTEESWELERRGDLEDFLSSLNGSLSLRFFRFVGTGAGAAGTGAGAAVVRMVMTSPSSIAMHLERNDVIRLSILGSGSM